MFPKAEPYEESKNHLQGSLGMCRSQGPECPERTQLETETQLTQLVARNSCCRIFLQDKSLMKRKWNIFDNVWMMLDAKTHMDYRSLEMLDVVLEGEHLLQEQEQLDGSQTSHALWCRFSLSHPSGTFIEFRPMVGQQHKTIRILIAGLNLNLSPLTKKTATSPLLRISRDKHEWPVLVKTKSFGLWQDGAQ